MYLVPTFHTRTHIVQHMTAGDAVARQRHRGCRWPHRGASSSWTRGARLSYQPLLTLVLVLADGPTSMVRGAATFPDKMAPTHSWSPAPPLKPTAVPGLQGIGQTQGKRHVAVQASAKHLNMLRRFENVFVFKRTKDTDDAGESNESDDNKVFDLVLSPMTSDAPDEPVNETADALEVASGDYDDARVAPLAKNNMSDVGVISRRLFEPSKLFSKVENDEFVGDACRLITRTVIDSIDLLTDMNSIKDLALTWMGTPLLCHIVTKEVEGRTPKETANAMGSATRPSRPLRKT